MDEQQVDLEKATAKRFNDVSLDRLHWVEKLPFNASTNRNGPFSTIDVLEWMCADENIDKPLHFSNTYFPIHNDNNPFGNDGSFKKLKSKLSLAANENGYEITTNGSSGKGKQDKVFKCVQYRVIKGKEDK